VVGCLAPAGHVGERTVGVVADQARHIDRKQPRDLLGDHREHLLRRRPARHHGRDPPQRGLLLGQLTRLRRRAIGWRIMAGRAGTFRSSRRSRLILTWRSGLRRSSAPASAADMLLRLVAEHGGRVLERGTVLPGSQHDGEPPAEVQFLEMPSEASLDAYMNDPRRVAMAAERDAAIARTDLFRIQPASRPEPEY
jgi:hypothetical protein